MVFHQLISRADRVSLERMLQTLYDRLGDVAVREMLNTRAFAKPGRERLGCCDLALQTSMPLAALVNYHGLM